MLVGDFVEDYEAMVPFQILTMVRHTVHTVCLDKEASEIVRTAVPNLEGDRLISRTTSRSIGILSGMLFQRGLPLIQIEGTSCEQGTSLIV